VGKISKARCRGNRTLLLLLLLSVISLDAGRAQSIVSDEAQIRAAMLFNLTKFIDWPASRMGDPQKPFTICYVGDDSIGNALNSLLSGKQVQGKPIAVQNISKSAQAAQCHILYVANSGRKQYKDMAAELFRNAVLTVSERQLGDNGIVIGLPRVDNSIQIQIDLKMAQSSALTISSKLLRIAAVTR
jgi:hypothetical protein